MSDKIIRFQDLDAWREGHKLVLMIYKTTKRFPNEELYGLVSQMRRSAVSITSNIAEGFCRFSAKEKVKFYFVALGSTAEIQNQLIIAKDVELIPASVLSEIMDQSVKVHKIINGLIRSSKRNI
jgi:four helix bundle protein